MLHLADLGFKQISVEPVVAEETDDYAIKEEDLPVLFKEYDDLAAEMVRRNKAGNGFNFFHFMIDLEGGPCVYKRRYRVFSRDTMGRFISVSSICR